MSSDLVRIAADELRALAALIERPPLDDVLLEQAVAVRSARAIRTVLAILDAYPKMGRDPASKGYPCDWERITPDEVQALIDEKDTITRLRAERDRLWEALQAIDIEASNTIPPDGKTAAFAALDRIVRIINPFRLPVPIARAAMGQQDGGEGA